MNAPNIDLPAMIGRHGQSGTAARGNANPFKIRTLLALILVSAVAFIALLYLIGAGETGTGGNEQGNHAKANGLQGYSGLAELLKLQGYKVEYATDETAFNRRNSLLILTPPIGADAQDISEILQKRQRRGPTLLILPKWSTYGFPRRLPDEITDQIKDGWVQLGPIIAPNWAGELADPYAIELNQTRKKSGNRAGAKNNSDVDMDGDPGADTGVNSTSGARQWQGMGFSGTLPDIPAPTATANAGQVALVKNAQGGVIAMDISGREGSEFYENANATTVIIEADLVNNYGLADQVNAALAMALVEDANYYDDKNRTVIFDLSMHGYGTTQNLLTLAFKPPFLAATLCLILALVLIGWRAFLRFGAPQAEGPAIAFGKSRLVANGAGLILRAKRLNLLGAPYAALIGRRLATRLGLPSTDPDQIDRALHTRFPDDDGFSQHADTLRNAHKPSEILRAAQALKEMERKISR